MGPEPYALDRAVEILKLVETGKLRPHELAYKLMDIHYEWPEDV